LRLTRSLALAAAVPLLLLGACGDDDEPTSSSTTQAEGGSGSGEKIVLYSGRDEKLIAPLIEAFTEETGIEVEVRYANSAEMAAQILEEGEDTPANVFYSQEVGAVGAIAKAGLLDDLPEDVVDRVDERFRPKQGTQWVGVTARARVIVYNPDKLEELVGSTSRRGSRSSPTPSTRATWRSSPATPASRRSSRASASPRVRTQPVRGSRR
jgi:iron(III) transport system substrate-binding protein